jgi:GTPase SAR1 family protein
LKIIVCGKKATGKTTLLEQLVYNNFSSQTKPNEKYISTMEDMLVACWEKDKNIKEKIRFYDTKGRRSVFFPCFHSFC